MRRCLSITILLVLGLVLTSCAQPTPQVIEKEVIQTVVVEKEVAVEREVPVIQTVVGSAYGMAGQGQSPAWFLAGPDALHITGRCCWSTVGWRSRSSSHRSSMVTCGLRH